MTDIKIYGKLVNLLVDNKLADAKQIYDEDYALINPAESDSTAPGNFQDKINKDVKDAVTDITEAVNDPQKDIICHSITVLENGDDAAASLGVYPGNDDNHSLVINGNAGSKQFTITHGGMHFDGNFGGIHVRPNNDLNDGVASFIVGTSAKPSVPEEHTAGVASNDNLSMLWGDRVYTKQLYYGNKDSVDVEALATKDYVLDRVNALIDGAPDAYNTLKEISDYIAQDKDAGAALTKSISDHTSNTDNPHNVTKEQLGYDANNLGIVNNYSRATDTTVQISQSIKDGFGNQPDNTSTFISAATAESAGVMAAADKAKLDSLYTNDQVDAKISELSNAPVAEINVNGYHPATMQSGKMVVDDSKVEYSITNADGLYNKMKIGAKVLVDYSDMDQENVHSILLNVIAKQDKHVAVVGQEGDSTATTYFISGYDPVLNKHLSISVNKDTNPSIIIS